MTPLLKKLNFKGHRQICVLDNPEEFGGEMKKMETFTSVVTSPGKCNEIDFAIVFVKSKAAVDKAFKSIEDKIQGDAILWFAYPKGTSKKYTADISRDKGWDTLGNAGFEVVRAVAIDDDWSAMRFRKAQFIDKMTRDSRFALSKEGKAKTRK
ncbi:MAG TPA: hypothetical protein VKZ86_08780 [Cyclobacteriaceae bacterium]|nr:hypothetical protein [Cyclobacteriaceae bacterium]